MSIAFVNTVVQYDLIGMVDFACCRWSASEPTWHYICRQSDHWNMRRT